MTRVSFLFIGKKGFSVVAIIFCLDACAAKLMNSNAVFDAYQFIDVDHFIFNNTIP
jgi:hypothetical protein